MKYAPSPTIIFKLDLLQGFVAVIDVSGVFTTQIYRTESDGYTRMFHSELWSSPEAARLCAINIQSAEKPDWWNTGGAVNLTNVENWREL